MMLQHKKLLTEEDLAFIFYDVKEKIARFKAMSAKEVFEAFGHSFRFRGKGIRSVAQNARQSQAIINLFSVIVANPLMLDAFERQGVNVTSMMRKVLQGQNLDLEEFIDKETADFAKERQLVREDALAQGELEGQGQQQPSAVNTPQGGPPSETEPGSGAGF